MSIVGKRVKFFWLDTLRKSDSNPTSDFKNLIGTIRGLHTIVLYLIIDSFNQLEHFDCNSKANHNQISTQAAVIAHRSHHKTKKSNTTILYNVTQTRTPLEVDLQVNKSTEQPKFFKSSVNFHKTS